MLLKDSLDATRRCFQMETTPEQKQADRVLSMVSSGWSRNSCSVDSTVGGFQRTMLCKVSGTPLGFTKQYVVTWALITERKVSLGTLSGLPSEVNIMKYHTFVSFVEVTRVEDVALLYSYCGQTSFSGLRNFLHTKLKMDHDRDRFKLHLSRCSHEWSNVCHYVSW